MAAATSGPDTHFFWDSYRHTSMGRYLGRREIAFIARWLGGGSVSRRLLEVACGSGRLTLPLHDQGVHVIGVDINPVALSEFRRQSPAPPLVLGDAEHLPFADGQFDGLIAVQAFASFGHGLIAQECARMLNQGGLLVFESLNRHSYKGVLARLVRVVAGWGVFDIAATRLPSLKALRHRLRRGAEGSQAQRESCRETLRAVRGQGFEIVDVSGLNWLPFVRLSNSRLVGVAAALERALRLDRLPAASPWVLLAARRKATD